MSAGITRRGSYPLNQPPSPARPGQTFSSPKVSEKPPRVPRNIRALKDGKSPPLAGRTIIVLLDGTGDKLDSDNSNIIHIMQCLKKASPDQIVYYQSGIGTYDGKGLSKGFSAGLDMAVGSGLGTHIRDAYRFLMQTFKENDRICIFGFSRGAYTARCLAGMIHKVGLLPAHNVSQVEFAYQFYKTDTPEGWKMSLEFKRTFCMDVSVYFLGVFDSVASVGFFPRKLPLSSTPYNKARYFRHALALDERRAKFKACRFQTKTTTEVPGHWDTVAEIHEDAMSLKRRESSLSANGHASGVNSPTNGLSRSGSLARRVPVPDHPIAPATGNDGTPNPAVTKSKSDERRQDTDVLEVWFVGQHADVGGGAAKNEVRHKLSQTPLRWMIRQCFECNTGIIFKTHDLASEGLDVHTLWPVYTPLTRPKVGPPPSIMDKYDNGSIAPISRRATVLAPVNEADPMGLHDVKLYEDAYNNALHKDWVPEQVEDYFDCVAPIHDQLVMAKTWWILEFWPIKVRVQPPDSDTWVKKVAMNLGRYRPVQDESPNMHWTVQQRMDALGYKIKARVDKRANWNVVV
jgi:uncharacterized protein (DUF2235 family)